MSEPVQSNQPASTSDDTTATVSDAVAQADAAVSAADLDAALAEVDKMEAATPDGSDAATAVGADAAAALQAEPVPSQDQLDAIASQVEATVFGGGTESDSVTATQPVLNSSAPSADLSVLATNTQPIVNSVATRPVAPAPTLPSFLPTTPPSPVVPLSTPSNPSPVPLGQVGAPSLAQPPTSPSSLGAPGFAPGGPPSAPYGSPPLSYGQTTQPGAPTPYPPAQFGQPGGFPPAGGTPPGYPGASGGGFGGNPGGGNGYGYPLQPSQPPIPGAPGFSPGAAYGTPSAPPWQTGGQPPYPVQGAPGQAIASPYPGGMGQPPIPGFGQPGVQNPYGVPGGQMPPGQSSSGQPVAPLAQALPPGTVISGPGSTPALAPPTGYVPGSPPPTTSAVPGSTPAQSNPTAQPISSSAPSPTPPTTTPGAVPGSSPPPTTPPAAPVEATPAPKPTVGGNKTYTSMIDVLADLKLLSDDKLSQLKQEFLTTGRNYEDLLLEKKWLGEEGITKAKAKLNNLPYITIGETGISPEALSKLDESVARRYGILPFAIDKVDRKLSVAMKNPLDIQAIAFVEQKTGFKLAVHYASPSEIERVIVERYAQNLSTEVNEALKDTDQTKVRHVEQDEQLANFGGVIRDAPINRIVETILEFAVKSRASDIHIEPLPNKVRVRYRIDGILVEKLILPRSVIDAVVSRIKILANMKIDEKRIPQDGRFNYSNDVKNVDLRVSTIPTVHGEKVNMRLLEKNLNVPTLEDLGLTGLALTNIKEAIKVPHGIILISGPTGSGKTTTLYSLINILNTPKVNIVTLEDPVEYQMIGVNQVQINTKAGLTFATGLRAFLRQDPNVIMVGEMRDRETTELAIQASLTGHLVFSTIHTSSAATALPRMTDMGAESFLIASSVTLIIAQRVVRKINSNYREEYVPDPAVIADIQRVLGPHFDNWCMEHGKTPQTLTLFRPSSNRPENEPEYLGRVAIYEVLRMNEAIGRMILQNRPASEMEAEGLRNGMMLMKQDGYMKVLNGITTIEEILRVADV